MGTLCSKQPESKLVSDKPKSEIYKEQAVNECLSCGQDCGKDKSNFLSCIQNHFICKKNDCLQNFINTIFSNPEVNIPTKCPICNFEYLLEDMETILKDRKERLEKYQMITLNQIGDLSENEVICRCPFCSYLEIRFKSGINFVFCQKETCKKRSCFFCYAECPVQDFEVLSEDNNQNEKIEIFRHFECSKLGHHLFKLEDAIDKGMKSKCPKCGLGGMKDDGCTHIACAKCGTNFCYICGLSEKDCDKADPSGSIFSHNADWEKNKKRCPMYLSQISEIDQSWPENDDESLEYFHRMNTMMLVKKAIAEIGEEFALIEAKYSFLNKHGLVLDQIMKAKDSLY